MTTHPDVPAAAAAAGSDAGVDAAAGVGTGTGGGGVDAELVERCQSSGDYLAGVIAAGLLDVVGQPEKLPTLLWPDADPVLVQAVWERAFVTGYRTRRLVERPEWTREGLDRLRRALAEAGYRGMARLAARSLTLHPDPGPVAEHPADAEAGFERLGGHGAMDRVSDEMTVFSTRSVTGGDSEQRNW